MPGLLDQSIPPGLLNMQPNGLLGMGIQQPDYLRRLQSVTQAMGLSPQEQALYLHHLQNLARGGVKNDDGSISTLRQMTVGMGDKTVSVPTVWDNQIVDEDEAMRRAMSAGITRFPAYPNDATAQKRYGRMHDFMEGDPLPPSFWMPY